MYVRRAFRDRERWAARATFAICISQTFATWCALATSKSSRWNYFNAACYCAICRSPLVWRKILRSNVKIRYNTTISCIPHFLNHVRAECRRISRFVKMNPTRELQELLRSRADANESSSGFAALAQRFLRNQSLATESQIKYRVRSCSISLENTSYSARS